MFPQVQAGCWKYILPYHISTANFTPVWQAECAWKAGEPRRQHMLTVALYSCAVASYTIPVVVYASSK